MKFNLICVSEVSGKALTFNKAVRNWAEARKIISLFMASLRGPAPAINRIKYEECIEKSSAVITNSEGTLLCTFYLAIIPNLDFDGVYEKGKGWYDPFPVSEW